MRRDGNVVTGTAREPQIQLIIRLHPEEAARIRRTIDRVAAILQAEAGPGIRVTKTDAARAIYCGNLKVLRLLVAEMEREEAGGQTEPQGAGSAA